MKYICLLVLLAACTTRDIAVKPQETQVIVQVHCNPVLPLSPVWRVPLMKHMGYPDKIKAMAQDLDAAHAYIMQLQAALEACK